MRRPVSALLPLLLVACAPTVKYIATSNPQRPMVTRAPATVEVFTASAPVRPFAEVGIITSETTIRGHNGQAWSGPAELIEALRVKGAEVGCDALLIQPGSGGSQQATCLVYR
jgi:hypothetical protein